MNKIKQLTKHLKAFDLVVIVFQILLIVINIIFRDCVEQWLTLVLLNTGIIAFAFIISFLASNYKIRFWKIIHYWYIAPLILITFKELYIMVKPIRQADYDWLFIEIDRWIFGTDPTYFLYQFSHPVITEILQVIYGMFYFLPLLLAVFLHRKKRYPAIDYAIFLIAYGFYLSYLGYFMLPGIGPRFTLHNFDTINYDLPGLFFTNFVREFVNTGESIPTGTLNPADVVQRDVFPSGHTMMTLVVMYLSVKLKSRSRFFFVPVGSLLILATVYLWYHYVIDLIGGFIFMLFAVWSGKYIFNWWQKILGKEKFNFDKA
jgi:membrane-associated phospholipid phosphatase